MKTGTLIVMVLFAVICGCEPKDRYSFYADSERILWANISINKLAQRSMNTGKQWYFTDDQVVAMVGKEPELRLKVADLPQLLDKDSNGDPNYSDSIMRDRVYQRAYLRAMELQGENSHPAKWQDSAHFKNLELWLYNYEKPLEQIVGGIISTRSGVFMTDFFLIEGSRVLGGGSIFRTFDHKN